MSIPPLPEGLINNDLTRTANALHSFAIHLLRRAREADKQSGLSPERLSLLSVLTYAGPLSVTRLSKLESVSLPAISRIVSALEQRGLVKRTRSREDARKVIVNATNKGRRIMEKGRRRRLEIIADELSLLPRKDQQQLSRISDIVENLGKPRDPSKTER
jgi:DNA-binding MarR family transcriptional regulator